MALVLIIEDDPMIATLLSRIVADVGHETMEAHTLKDGLQAARSNPYDVVFLDLDLPDGNGLSILPDLSNTESRPEVIIVTGTGDQRGAEVAFKHGAWAFVQKPFKLDDVALPLSRALQYRAEKLSSLRPKVFWREGMVGRSPQFKAGLEQVAVAAGSDAPALLTGETGTGKELFARAIHQNSSRSKAPFIVVDCASLPENLVGSTLFGHEKGAFTGADKAYEGLVKQADKGTLFLDEIGELKPGDQRSFLRVLQEKRFRPVGGRQEERSDFRLIAATNRDLEQMVADGEFREDLLFRIRSFHIHLPPLRERKEDVKELVIHSITVRCEQYGMETKGFAPEFIKTLEQYDWPGNVRELVLTIDMALAAAMDSPVLYPIHLPAHLRTGDLHFDAEKPPNEGSPFKTGLKNLKDLPSWRQFKEETMDRIEAEYLTELMRRTQGGIKEAIEISQLSESRLHSLLKKHQTPRFRS